MHISDLEEHRTWYIANIILLPVAFVLFAVLLYGNGMPYKDRLGFSVAPKQVVRGIVVDAVKRKDDPYIILNPNIEGLSGLDYVTINPTQKAFYESPVGTTVGFVLRKESTEPAVWLILLCIGTLLATLSRWHCVIVTGIAVIVALITKAVFGYTIIAYEMVVLIPLMFLYSIERIRALSMYIESDRDEAFKKKWFVFFANDYEDGHATNIKWFQTIHVRRNQSHTEPDVLVARLKDPYD